MTKLDMVAASLLKQGYIDGTTIRRITNTTCARDYIYKLKKRRGITTVPHHISPTHTRWLLGSIRNRRKAA